MKERASLRQCECLRCGNQWWPRQPQQPRRCAACKSQYWNRPRKRGMIMIREPGKRPHRIASSALHVPAPAPTPSPDQSASRLFTVLKEMKGNNVPWAEILERVRQEFGVELTKDQVKTLVR